MVLFYYKQAEAEHEEKYFIALEKKEKMEEKMDSVMEVEVKLFKCKQVSGRVCWFGTREHSLKDQIF